MTFVPNNQRYPVVAININNEFAVEASGNQPYRTLMIANKISTGSMANDSFSRILSLGDAAVKFGVGSNAYEMAKGYFAGRSNNPLYALILDEPSGAVARVMTVTLTGTGIKAGTLNLYIAGKKLTINVAEGDTITEIAANIKSLMDDDDEFLFTVAVAAGVATLTAKNKGAFSSSLQIEHSVGMDESLPENLNIAIAETTAGTGVYTSLDLSNIEDDVQYILMGSVFTDNAFLNSVNTELVARNTATRKVDGYLIAAIRDTLANLTTKGNAFNTQFISLFPVVGNTNYLYYTGILLGIVSREKSQDPGKSLQDIPLTGVLAPRPSEVLSNSELNTLLNNGVSAYGVQNGVVTIQSMITTYKTDKFGLADISYLDLSVLLILSYLRFDMDAVARRRFSGAKIGMDGVRYNSDQKIVTEKGIKGELVNRYTEWMAAGLVENKSAFEKSLVVERNRQNVNQIDIFLYPNTINELRILGIDIRFLL